MEPPVDGDGVDNGVSVRMLDQIPCFKLARVPIRFAASSGPALCRR